MVAVPHTQSFVAYNKAEEGSVPTLVGNWVEVLPCPALRLGVQGTAGMTPGSLSVSKCSWSETCIKPVERGSP